MKKLIIATQIINLILCLNIAEAKKPVPSSSKTASKVNEMTFEELKANAENGDAKAQYLLGLAYIYWEKLIGYQKLMLNLINI